MGFFELPVETVIVLLSAKLLVFVSSPEQGDRRKHFLKELQEAEVGYYQSSLALHPRTLQSSLAPIQGCRARGTL